MGITKNIFFSQPKSLLKYEIEKLPRKWEANFYSKNHGYILHYLNNETTIIIEYYGILPPKILENFSDKFKEEKRLVFGQPKRVFSFKFGQNTPETSYRSGRIFSSPEYYLAKPIRFELVNSFKKMDLKSLSAIINSKKCVFYSGAGLSANSNVLTMNQFLKTMGIDLSKPEDKFALDTLKSPAQVSKKFSEFCNSAFTAEPTPGHMAVANIISQRRISLITENFDFLHERSGLLPFHADEEISQTKINPDWLTEIDYFICLGLQHDDRGLLALFKKQNPAGKIIALNISHPTYLSESDYLLKVDLQSFLPKLYESISQ